MREWSSCTAALALGLALLAPAAGAGASPDTTRAGRTETPGSPDSLEAPRMVRSEPPRIRINGPFERCLIGVYVTVEVNEEGRVARTTMDYSAVTWTERAGFAFAMETVKDWTFRPAMLDGKPVESAVRFPLILVKDGVTPESERLAPGAELELFFDIPLMTRSADSTEVRRIHERQRRIMEALGSSSVSRTPATLVEATWPTTTSYWFREDLRLEMGAVIREDGSVGETWIINPPGRDYRVLEKACVDAAKQWRFRPPRRDGQPTRCKIRIPFVYSFEDDRWTYSLMDSP